MDKEIQTEIKKDKANYWKNTVEKKKPKYLLAPKIYLKERWKFYQENYQLLKEFRIKNHLNSDNKILEKIYRLKPSGTDYNLYERK